MLIVNQNLAAFAYFLFYVHFFFTFDPIHLNTVFIVSINTIMVHFVSKCSTGHKKDIILEKKLVRLSVIRYQGNDLTNLF